MTDNNLKEIEEAADRWLDWKTEEDWARSCRLKAEKALLKLIPQDKAEGTSTLKQGDYKITLTAKLNRTLDADAYHAIVDQIPVDLRPVRYKAELDLKGIRYLENNEPDTYALIAHCINTKPAKAAVKVEAL
jgi:hypothetical protein